MYCKKLFWNDNFKVEKLLALKRNAHYSKKNESTFLFCLLSRERFGFVEALVS